MTHAELHRILHGGIRNTDRKTFKEAYGFMRALKRPFFAYYKTGKNNMETAVEDVIWSNIFCGVPPDVEKELGDIIFPKSTDVAYRPIEHRSKWLMKVNYKGDSRRFVKREDLERKLRLDMNKGIM